MKTPRLFSLLFSAAVLAGSCTQNTKTEGATTTEKPREANVVSNASGDNGENNTVSVTEDHIRLFVTAPTGISMRAQPSATAPEVAHPLYGYEVAYSNNNKDFPANGEKTTLDGIPGYWVPITYEGKTGYIPNIAVLSFPPPRAQDSSLKDWLNGMAKPMGPRFEQKPDWDKMGDMGTGIVRQLYNNGAVYTEGSGYEWGHTMLQLPGNNVGNVLYALRNLRSFSEVLKGSGTLRRGTYKVNRPNAQYGAYNWKVKIENTPYNDYLEGIEVEWEDGGYSGIKVMQVQSDVAIISYGGV